MSYKSTVLINGASSPLGRSLCEKFAEDNCKVLALHRKRKKIFSNNSGEIIEFPEIDLVKTNLSDTLIPLLVEHTIGDLNVVNCVGHFPGYRTLLSKSTDEVRRVIDSNFTAVVLCTQALLPLLINAGKGSVVMISSHAVQQAYPLCATFLASKAAIEAFTRGIANEYGKHGIRCNAIAPSTIDSPFERSLMPNGDFEHWVTPSQIFGVIDDLLHGAGTVQLQRDVLWNVLF
jgi:NAD(P)-dependent dehydrogenase (short-subunit alcohol dehydrogenase family)